MLHKVDLCFSLQLHVNLQLSQSKNFNVSKWYNKGNINFTYKSVLWAGLSGYSSSLLHLFMPGQLEAQGLEYLKPYSRLTADAGCWWTAGAVSFSHSLCTYPELHCITVAEIQSWVCRERERTGESRISFCHLAMEVTPCDSSEAVPEPSSFKNRENTLCLMGEWEGSGWACATRNIAVAIFVKCNVS